MYYLRSSENKKKDLAFFFLGPGLISASPYFRKSKKATVLLYHKIIFREIYCTGVITLHSEHTKHVNLAFLFLTLNMASQDCFVTRRTLPNIWNGASCKNTGCLAEFYDSDKNEKCTGESALSLQNVSMEPLVLVLWNKLRWCFRMSRIEAAVYMKK